MILCPDKQSPQGSYTFTAEKLKTVKITLEQRSFSKGLHNAKGMCASQNHHFAQGSQDTATFTCPFLGHLSCPPKGSPSKKKDGQQETTRTQHLNKHSSASEQPPLSGVPNTHFLPQKPLLGSLPTPLLPPSSWCFNASLYPQCDVL